LKYQVIARRYRPRRFDEVVGQESIAQTLRGAMVQDRIAHAYLFTGPRGVGKTSMARIFAKALDCPEASDPSLSPEERGVPCDRCTTCEAIHTGQDIDVVELDGASHRGIEDIRTIIEGIHRPPTRGPFKVYIIDEVHMLTREAFNALLKTLEEPPSHVKFVFATTEPHRIPETVLSRCQRFDFHPIGGDAIARRLAQICEAEGRKAEPGLLEKIASYSKGGLRDAQTLLDQLITVSPDVLTSDDLDRVTGRLAADAVGDLTDAAVGGDAAAVLGRARASFAAGADPAIVLEQVIEALRERLHAAAALAAAEGKAQLDRILGALHVLIDVASKLKASPNAEASVEIALLKVARLEDPAALEDVIRALFEIEKREDARPGRGGEGGHDPGSRPHDPSNRRGAESAPPTMAPRQGPAPELRVRSSPQILPGSSPTGPSRAPRAQDSLRSPPSEGGSLGGREASDLEVRAEERTSTATAVATPEACTQVAALTACDFRSLLSVWGQIGIELESKHPDIAPIFRDREPVPSSEDDLFSIELGNDFYFRQMKSSQRLGSFLAVVREVSGAPWRFRLQHSGKVIPSPAGAPAPAPPAGTAARGGRSGAETAPGNGKSSHESAEPACTEEAAPTAGKSSQGRMAGGPPQGARADSLSRSPLVKKSLDLFNGRLV